MAAYAKPAGYNAGRLISGSQRYKPFNMGLAANGQGLIQGNTSYSPAVPSMRVPYSFSAAPANNATITIPDGPTNRVFTFTYAGSPGAGVIPLVAGGGTAAQAATASQVAMAAQLRNWVVTNPSSAVLVLVSRNGYNPGISNFVTPANITLGAWTSLLGNVLPARFGKNYAFLPG